MRIHIVILLILAIRINGQCNQGCLICSSNNLCSFCDFHGYIASGVKCVAFQNPNCNYWDQTGTCISCASGYHIDVTIGKCIQVPKESIITNCLVYTSSSTCSMCNSGFLTAKNACAKSPITINGCNILDSAKPGNCLFCSPDYVLSFDGTSCLPVGSSQSCSGYTLANCLACNTGYYLNLNLYQSVVFNILTPTSMTNYMYYDDLGIVDQGTFPGCQAIVVQNCATYASYNKCATCLPNFFMDNTANCQPFPPQVILNCLVYSSVNSCIQCQTGFYLLSSQNCAPAPPSNNCAEYDSSSSSLICALCQTGFYLGTDKACVPRKNSNNISLCTAFDPNSDSCLTCQSGLLTTTDGLACLAVISNCNTYAPSTLNTPKLICSLCNAGLYYISESSTCVLGSTLNCQTYQKNTGICLVCLNGFYLSNGVCIKHPVIDSCQAYSQNLAGICTVCQANHFLFINTNTCTKVQPIVNCASYATSATCSVCADGNYLTNTFQCAPIVLPQNCLQLSAQGACTLCQTGYYLTTEECLLPYQYFGQNCAANTGTGTNPLSSMNCRYCITGFIPFNYLNSYACLPQSYLTNIQTIAQCVKYQTLGDGRNVCTGCSPGYFINLDGTCVASCGSGVAYKMIEAFNGPPDATAYTNFYVTRNYVCTQLATTANCAVYYPDLFTHPTTAGEVGYNCRACLAGFYQSIVDLQTVGVDNPSTTPFSINPVAAYPGVACNARSSMTLNGSSTGVVIDYCQYYYSYGTNWGCYKCQFGYSGIVTVFPGQTTIGYISVCASIPACTQVIYDGHTTGIQMVQAYKTPLGALFSCYSCTNSMIPFLAIDFRVTTTIPAINKFGTSSSPYNTGSGGLVTNCYAPVAASFGITPANFNFPSNCGLGIIKTPSVNDASTSTSDTPGAATSAVYCYACLPGFSPSLATTDTEAPLLVKACSPIPFCYSSVWLNSCTKCNPNYAYSYNSNTHMVSFSSCVLSADPGNNCFAVNSLASPPSCKYCNPGFNLNYDGVCEPIIAYMCNNQNMNFFMTYNAIKGSDNHAVGLYLMPNGPGCTVCQAGFIAVKVTVDQFVCSTSSYFASNIYVLNTKFVNGCKNYYVNSTTKLLTCLVCDTNMVVSTTGLCYSKFLYQNCILVDDSLLSSIVCGTCAPNFILVLGNCQVPAIANCAQYSNSIAIQSQICQTCNAGYYLNGNTCVRGLVANCQQQTSANACNVCLPGFVLLTLSNGNNYCYPIPANNNCLVVGSGFSSGLITCATCATEYIPSPTVLAPNSTVCGTFNKILNCEAYNTKGTLLQSDFQCSSCVTGFYLSGNGCVARVNLSSQCATYSSTTDQCLACSPGYFLSTNQLACIPNPVGIPGCVKYSSLTVCTACQPNTYLQDNKCSQIASGALIQFCATYLDATTCATCQLGYVLTSKNVCSLSTATNCLTFASTTACASCQQGYGLKQQSNGLSCVPISDKNCIDYNIVYPFNCNKCSSDYYVLNSVCAPVQVSINFCRIYDSATTCLQCNNGYILAQNRLSCTRNINLVTKFDSQCMIMAVATSPVCNKCKPGYYFQGTFCVPCPKSASCYACSEENPNKCLVCMKGYSQIANGSCSLNSVTPTASKFGDKSVHFNRACLLLILSVLHLIGFSSGLVK